MASAADEGVRAATALRRPSLTHGLAGAWLLLGVLMLAGLLLGARQPALVDAMVWRFELLEPAPTLRQRIHERRAADHHRDQDALVPAGTVLLFGDSHLAALPASLLGQAHNFAIGQQTVARLVERMPAYASLRRAGGVVLNGGGNDLDEGHTPGATLQAWAALLALMPEGVPLLCVGVPEPEAGSAAAEPLRSLNAGVAELCRARGARFLPVTPGRHDWARAGWRADGVHLDREGSLLLASRIRDAFAGVARP